MQKFLSQWYDQPHSTPPFSFQYNYIEFSESREPVARDWMCTDRSMDSTNGRKSEARDVRKCLFFPQTSNFNEISRVIRALVHFGM